MAVDDDSDHFPSFFKIILEPRFDLHKLEIPKKFVRDYGDDLLDVVSLKIPTGKTWKVKLVKEKGRVWFKDGWPEFANYYSICHGHFLMFTYGRNTHFNVHIFDLTACEIDYPLDPEETPELFQKRVSGTKTKINSTSPSFLTKEKEMAVLVRQYRSNFGTLTREIIKKINSYRFENPSFAVMMQPSYVKFKFCLNVPSKFAAEYLNTKGRFTLENPNGDTWPVNCVGNRPKKLSVGWKEFALDNKLRVGDFCVFELMKPAKRRLFKVEIIRCSSGVVVSSSSSSTGSPAVKNEVISID